MQTIDVRAQSRADADTLYALLTDGASWPAWSPIGSFELERPGDSAREGLGAIRVFRTGRTNSRERLVELVPGKRLSYALLSGLPLRGYRADVDLTPKGAGTEIRWHSTFTAKVPGTGWLYRLALGRFIQRCANGLAARGDAITSAAVHGDPAAHGGA
jgi:Polyketide cyclase / dehydrase and lipid transport